MVAISAIDFKEKATSEVTKSLKIRISLVSILEVIEKTMSSYANGSMNGFHHASHCDQCSRHVGVNQVLRTVRFKAALHWKNPDGSSEIAHLKLQQYFLEMFWYRDQNAAPDSASELATDLPRIGVKHLALRVESVDAARIHLIDRQVAPPDVEVRDGKTGVRYFFVKDPSGILLEILEDNRYF